MNVADIMTPKPSVIRPENTLRTALKKMEKGGYRHLPVISSEEHLIGILSDRDCRTALNSPYILHKRWQDEDLLDRLAVGGIMTPAPIIIEPDAFVNEAARLMLVNHISCLPVMRGETLIGIITTSDILRSLANTVPHPSGT